MAAELHVTPSRATDADGLNLSGAKWFFYQTGTTTPQSVYTTSALSVAHASPVVADAGGKFAPIYFNAALAYRGVLKTADEATTIYDIDPINTDIISQLAADGGAALIGTSTGDTVEEVLTAYDGRLDAIETITPTGENASDSLADLLRPIASGPREALVYNDADSVKVFSSYVTMGGFRFRGQYLKGRGPVFAMPSTKVAEYNTTGCPVFSTVKTETWVGVFACADSGAATATLRTMPFLRLAAPVGSTANIIKGGENVHDLVTTASHSWASTNNLAGTECLVISEGGNAFSGRVTTITANTSTSVTLASIGTIAAGDYILPAPPGFDHYVYLGSFYFDTAEVRNIYDSGTLVKAKMISITADESGSTGFLAGSEASPVLINARGYICPLATAVVIGTTSVLSTTSAGDYAEYFAGDTASHNVDERYDYRGDAEANKTVAFGNIQIPFLYHQSFAYSNAGSLAVNRASATMPVWGWIEP